MIILILANKDSGLYIFRKELIEELITQGHRVYISLPKGEWVYELERLGCVFVETNVNRRGTNPLEDFKLLMKYKRIVLSIKPDIVLTYTIKPNVYGGIACRFFFKTHFFPNITGLGTSIENKGVLCHISLFLYRFSLRKATCVFFQNEANLNLFKTNKLLASEAILLPGSGVNVHQHVYEKYPDKDKGLRLLFVGRIMKNKGVEELFEAAKIINRSYKNIFFDFVGMCEENYRKELYSLSEKGIINYYGPQKDVHDFYKKSHGIILPSYHEGTSNVLLEAASTGRPVLASNVPGCRETFNEGLSGISFEPRNTDSLVAAIESFIEMHHERKESMGFAGRLKMEEEYDREIVVDKYLQEIERVGSSNG